MTDGNYCRFLILSEQALNESNTHFAHSNSRNNYGILIYGNYLYPAYSAGRFSAWTYHLENAACRFY